MASQAKIKTQTYLEYIGHDGKEFHQVIGKT